MSQYPDSNSRGGPSNYDSSPLSAAGNGKNLPPWLNGKDGPPQGWMPSWDKVPMSDSQSRPQENPNWYAGQIEIPEGSDQQSEYLPTSYSSQSRFKHPGQGPHILSQSHSTPISQDGSDFVSPKNPSSKARKSIDTPERDGVDLKPKSDTNTNAVSAAGKKRKRKSQVVGDASIDDISVPSPLEDGDKDKDKDKEKRTKTGRACDACRTKKIRCDILPSEESTSGLDSQPICAHCKQSNLECTFFLPITETRFKKKRQAAKEVKEPPSASQQPTSLPQVAADVAGGSPGSYDYENLGGGPSKSKDWGGGRVEGPTSIAFLLHTTIPTIPSEAFDLRHHNSWEVLEDGNGVIRVNAPPTAPAHADADPSDPTRAHNRLNKPVLSGQTMSLLVNAYFKEVAPLFPIISRSEFAARTTPSPLLLYSICGLGATRRQFPREIFAGVRGVINGLLRSNDILSDARFENVQALLLLAQVGDLHAQPTAATASASLIRTGAAIRMAQDLGLHRESAVRAIGPRDLEYVELRRRVWATCVIMDRWYGAALGIPLLVDLLDCDVLLPAPYQISTLTEPHEWPLEFSFMGLGEHLKLSILMGRVLKMIYSPTGLKHTTDAQLAGLVDDMEKWKADLPEGLQFKGKDSSHVVGLLHLGYTALQFLFWRVFMRITYSCPPHLKFSLQISHWSKMIEWSRECLEWLDANDDALDTLFIFPYAATSCALIQYHTWARRGDDSALATLKLVKQTATRWEHAVQPDQMSIRRKTCETMTLLYEAALKTDPESHEMRQAPKLPANPTAGVIPRQSGSVKLQFKKDESRQGGGVFVAETEQEIIASGLRQGDVVLASDISEGKKKELETQIAGQENHLRVGRQIEEESQSLQREQQTDQSRNRSSNGELNGNINAFQQSLPKETYNVNPLITTNGSYSKYGMSYSQDGNASNLGEGMMDVTRQAQHYAMPSYPPIQELQQQQQQQLQNYPMNSHQQMYQNMPNSYSGSSSMANGNSENTGYVPGQQPYQPGGMNQPMPGVGVGPTGNLDPGFLDSLPVSTFDWESWSDYFDKFLPNANQNFETMQ
ncbi:uncharacterized protein I206_106572 [Kwoniella pini CBS 10737]|uniref:Zn(2)-C6 fungal-type domain-containing protein n=1 Tax=Kwoniella pini CBS 10737 TaxID=1296096 RepID=A0A1B9HTT2_9TREE|nr:uncharacterized protein I206_07537 [Kwoniella pini CBS 10737]OCF46682.1 hypothetical protein I206_07537 [Kwoniella pini CBS 10737]